MSAEPLNCPFCNATIPPSPGLVVGQKMACPRCGEAFTVTHAPAPQPTPFLTPPTAARFRLPKTSACQPTPWWNSPRRHAADGRHWPRLCSGHGGYAPRARSPCRVNSTTVVAGQSGQRGGAQCLAGFTARSWLFATNQPDSSRRCMCRSCSKAPWARNIPRRVFRSAICKFPWQRSRNGLVWQPIRSTNRDRGRYSRPGRP